MTFKKWILPFIVSIIFLIISAVIVYLGINGKLPHPTLTMLEITKYQPSWQY